MDIAEYLLCLGGAVAKLYGGGANRPQGRQARPLWDEPPRNAERAIDPSPENRGVRMDIYVRDSGRVYDVEMQRHGTTWPIMIWPIC